MWFDEALRLFGEVPFEGGKNVSAREFFLALKHGADIYTIIWGAGLLASTLEADMVKVSPCIYALVEFSVTIKMRLPLVCVRVRGAWLHA